MAKQKGSPKTGGRLPGTPNKVTASIREHAQEYTIEALDALVKVLRSDDAPPAAKVAAANSILDRGHGKPSQAINVDTSMKHEQWLDILESFGDLQDAD